MLRRSRILFFGLIATLVAISLVLVASPAAPQSSSFVTRAGDQLQLDGDPFVFTGLNIPNANSDGWCFKALDMNQVLDDVGPGKAVIRARPRHPRAGRKSLSR